MQVTTAGNLSASTVVVPIPAGLEPLDLLLYNDAPHTQPTFVEGVPLMFFYMDTACTTFDPFLETWPSVETHPANVTFRMPSLSAGTHEFTFLAVAATPGAPPPYSLNNFWTDTYVLRPTKNGSRRGTGCLVTTGMVRDHAGCALCATCDRYSGRTLPVTFALMLLCQWVLGPSLHLSSHPHVSCTTPAPYTPGGLAQRQLTPRAHGSPQLEPTSVPRNYSKC
jgi:hypothetical protein